MCCQSPVSFSSSDDMEMCSLKVLELEGSPSRTLLRLMGDRGCTAGHLMDYLQTLGNSEALQCLKPSGTVTSPQSCYVVVEENAAKLCLGTTVNVSFVYSLADSHSAPVSGSYIWPQSAPQLPRCG